MATKARRKAPEKLAVWRWKRELEKLGFHVTLTMQPQRAMMTPGIPDMYLRHPRWKIRMWVEAKAGKNTATRDQIAWAQTELEAGGLWILAYSLDDILAAARKAGAPIT